MYNHTLPAWPVIAKLPWSNDVQKVLDTETKVFDAWIEADTALFEAEAELAQAQKAASDSIVVAARNGDSIPELPNMSELEHKLAFAVEVDRVKRFEVSQAAERIEAKLRENTQQVLALSVDKAEKGIEEFAERIEKAREIVESAERDFRESIDGLLMVSHGYTQPYLTMTPPSANVGEWSLPQTYQQDVRQFVSSVRSVLELLPVEVTETELENA